MLSENLRYIRTVLKEASISTRNIVNGTVTELERSKCEISIPVGATTTDEIDPAEANNPSEGHEILLEELNIFKSDGKELEEKKQQCLSHTKDPIKCNAVPPISKPVTTPSKKELEKLGASDKKIRRHLLFLLILGIVGFIAAVLTGFLMGSNNFSRGNHDEVAISLQEVALHDTLDDCWMIINGTVYDLTTYVSIHPGGAETLTLWCGMDASWAYFQVHPTSILGQVANLLVGALGTN